MKLRLLAAVASAALISAGVAAQAQDNQRHDQQPAMEHAQPKDEAAPRAGGAMKREAPKAAESDRQGAPKAAETQRQEQPKAADTQRKESPKAAETQRSESPKAAETQRKESPKAAETQRKEGTKAAEGQHDQMQRQGEARDEKGMKQGANDNRREAQRGEGPARVTGKVRISDEHAQRVDAALRRNSRPERVDVDIRVGERIPETVVIRPLPADVISIVPEYRGYDYFVDSSDEIVFVSPESHEIVGTIGYEGRAAAEDATQVSAARPCPAHD